LVSREATAQKIVSVGKTGSVDDKSSVNKTGSVDKTVRAVK
jgi:hypothetical protein